MHVTSTKFDVPWNHVERGDIRRRGDWEIGKSLKSIREEVDFMEAMKKIGNIGGVRNREEKHLRKRSEMKRMR